MATDGKTKALYGKPSVLAELQEGGERLFVPHSYFTKEEMLQLLEFLLDAIPEDERPTHPAFDGTPGASR